MNVIDERLSASAPRAAPIDARSQLLLEALVTETVAPRRRRRGLLIGGVMSAALVLGGASAALATPALGSWLGWAPDRQVQTVAVDGRQCVAGYAIEGEGVPDSDPAVIAARDILKGIDFQNLSISADTAQAAAERVARRDASLTAAGADARQEAVDMTVVELISDGVTARGLDVGNVAVRGGIKCGTEAAQ